MGSLRIIPLEDRIVFDAAALVTAYPEVTAATNLIFVDASDGNNGNGVLGSETNPYDNLADALSEANTGDDAIFMAADFYTTDSQLNLPDGVKIYGGFEGVSDDIIADGDGWNPDQLDYTNNGSVIDAQNTHRIFQIDAATVTLHLLNLRNGNTAGNGGAINAINMENDTLTIKQTSVNNNSAGLGGAIFMLSGTLDITDSVIRSNSANDGGAIYKGGSLGTMNSLNLDNTSFTINTATNNGGAIRFGGSATFNISNSGFSSNSAENGGAIYTASTGTLDIDNTNFSNNVATDTSGLGGGGAIYSTGSSSLNIHGTVDDSLGFSGNNALSGLGGAIFSDHSMAIEYATFTQNNAASGGAIYMASGTLNMSNIILSRNQAGSEGGGIYARNGANILIDEDSTIVANSAQRGGGIMLGQSNLSVDSSYFVLNEATGSGGAIYASDSTINITNPLNYEYGAFEQNTSDGVGGAIFLINTSHLTLSDITLNNNRADLGGGAIYSDGSTAVILDSSFSTNTSVGEFGGAIRLENGSNFTIGEENGLVTFDHNTGAIGGAIYSRNSTMTIVDADFEFNDAQRWGGAIYSVGETTTDISLSGFSDNTSSEKGAGAVLGTGKHNFLINNSSFTDNSTTGTIGGGGIALRGGAVMTLSNSAMTHNSSTSNGGAIYADLLSQINLVNTLIFNNHADGNGGGVYTENGTLYGDAPPGTGSTFQGNTALGNGGAVYGTSTAQLFLTLDTYSGNSATNGGAVFSAGMLSLTNSTLTSNTATQEGGAVYTVSTTATVSNTTFDSNSATVGGAIASTNTTLTVSDVTVTNNTATVAGGGIAQNGGTSTITNTTLSSNTATGTDGQGGALWLQNTATTTVTTSTFNNNTSTSGGDTIFTYEGSSVNGQTETTQIEQALTDAGNTVPEDTVDAGNASTFTTVLYVDGSVTTSGDGSSFDTAFKTLVEALTTVDQLRDLYISQGVATTDSLFTVLVAEGVYTPGDARGDTFSLMDNNLVIKGGYDASTGLRDIANHVTVLSGEIGTSALTDNIYTILTASEIEGPNRITLDGMTVTGAFNNSTNSKGGGLKSMGDIDLTLNNMIFEHNTAGTGGAVYNEGGNFVVIGLDTRMIQNTATTGGGGAIMSLASLDTLGSLTVVGARFVGNDADAGNGGAISVLGHDSALILGVQLTNNRALNGGGISLVGVSTATVAGSQGGDGTDSVANRATNNGGTLYIVDSEVQVLDNTFKTSNDAAFGDQMYAENSTVNGYSTATQAQDVINSLLANNTFNNFDEDDLYII